MIFQESGIIIGLIVSSIIIFILALSLLSLASNFPPLYVYIFLFSTFLFALINLAFAAVLFPFWKLLGKRDRESQQSTGKRSSGITN